MYSRLLAKYPLATKSVTSGFLFSLGDVLTQKLIQHQETINWRRNLSLTLTGAFYLGPCLHFWYSKYLPAVINKCIGDTPNKYKRAFTGMIFDQILFAPTFLSGFFIVMGFNSSFSMEGVKQGYESMKKKISEALLTNWKIWPLATMINLSFVPMQYQVLFANFVGLFWNMYLSYLANK